MVSIQEFNDKPYIRSPKRYTKLKQSYQDTITDIVRDIANNIKESDELRASVIFDIHTERIFNRYSYGKLLEIHWNIDNGTTRDYLKRIKKVNKIDNFKEDVYHSSCGNFKLVPDVENFWVFKYANLLVKLTPEDLAHDYRVILPMLYIYGKNSEELRQYNKDINKLKELKKKQDDFTLKFIKSKISLSRKVTKNVVKRYIHQIPDDVDDPFNENEYLGFSSLHIPSEISDNECNKDIKLYKQVFYPNYNNNAFKLVLTEYAKDSMAINSDQAKTLVNKAWSVGGRQVYYADRIFNLLNDNIDLINNFNKNR